MDSNTLSVQTTYRGSLGGESSSPLTPSKRRPTPLKPVATAPQDTAQVQQEESQADALLRAKRERAKKRQTMPEGQKIDLHPQQN